MTNEEVIKNFLVKKNGYAGNLYVCGALFSYGTTIAYWKGDKLIVNVTKYSPTTSHHQSMLIENYIKAGLDTFDMLIVNGLKRDCIWSDLNALADKALPLGQVYKQEPNIYWNLKLLRKLCSTI